jgi:uncharacterized membrane protein
MSKSQHVYALFESPEAARDAYQAVQAGGCATEHCSAIVHHHHIDDSLLTFEEGASREGARDGAIVAGTTGAIIGGLATLGGGLLGIGPLAGLVLGGGVMAAYGALLGGIAGSDEHEQHLRKLEEELVDGRVLIAVETDDPQLEQMCESVFQEHGGRQVAF